MRDRFLVVKGSSGMGNRLGALLTAIAYAELSERILIIDWDDSRYAPDGEDVFHRLFASPRTPSVSVVPPGASAVPAPWQGKVGLGVEKLSSELAIGPSEERRRQLSIDVGRLDYQEDVAVFFDFYFDYKSLLVHQSQFPPRFRVDDEEQLIRLLLSEVRPSKRIRDKVRRFARRHFSKTTIGAHVRQTDNMRPSHVRTKGVPLDALEPLVESCLRDAPKATLFLATDNRAMLARFAERFAVVERPKWYPDIDGEALHGNRRCPDKLAMAEDALVDSYLLAACDVLVYSSRSSFGRFANYLASPRQKAVDVTSFEAFRRSSSP